MADRFLNLVFQGGGVRGIAYAGALQAMPKNYRIHTVAGASAGAIVAGLVGIGKTAEQITEILSQRELFELIEPAEAQRTARIQGAFSEISKIFSEQKGDISGWRAWQLKRKYKNIVSDLGEVMAERGLHKTERLRAWLDKITEGKTFEQATGCEQLKIVAADVSRREYSIYTKANSGSRPIAEKILASASIPVFFTPFFDGTSVLVDGGLLSNFPTFLVLPGGFPTIGFELDDFLPPDKINDTFSYLKALLLTMTDAHDKQRGFPSNFKSYPIYTAKIAATKFDLTADDLTTLFQLGLGVGNGVDWLKYSAEKPEASYDDPNSRATLRMSLKQAHALWQSFSQKEMWLEGLKHDAVFTVRIEKDWSAVYDRVGTVTVTGERPLFVSKFAVEDTATEMGSLADTKYLAEEILSGGGTSPLIAIPAFNGLDFKGFLLFLTPPVAAGKPRVTHTQFRIPLEFADKLGKGLDGTISYGAARIAEDHQLRLLFRVLVDQDLPELEVTSQFGSKFEQLTDEADANAKRFYRRYECQLPWTPVGGNTDFPVTLSLK